MSDTRARFRALDRVAVPDLWPDVTRRALVMSTSSVGQVSVRRTADGSLARLSGQRSGLSRAWVLGIVLLAVLSIGVGGLVAGVWRFDDLRPPVVQTPVPTLAPTAEPVPTLVPTAEPTCSLVYNIGQPTAFSVTVFDETGLIEACSFTRDVPIGSMTRADMRIVNGPRPLDTPSMQRLEITWVIATCDTASALRFAGDGPTYQVILEREVDAPCTGREPSAVDLMLSRPVDAGDVRFTVVDP